MQTLPGPRAYVGRKREMVEIMEKSFRFVELWNISREWSPRICAEKSRVLVQLKKG
jgi:hypothetical protein